MTPKQRDFEYFTVDEAARLLSVSPRTIRRLASRGEMPSYRFGCHVRILKSEFYDYVQNSMVRPESSQKPAKQSPDRKRQREVERELARRYGI